MSKRKSGSSSASGDFVAAANKIAESITTQVGKQVITDEEVGLLLQTLESSSSPSAFVPVAWFLDVSGSMDTPFKKQALQQVLKTIETLNGPYAVTEIASTPKFSLRMGLHPPQDLEPLYQITPNGGTYLWEVIGSCLLRYAEAGVKQINVSVLTDGEDTSSNGKWKGFSGSVQLIRLARELDISLTISFVQLGGTEREATNLQCVADVSGGAFLQMHESSSSLTEIDSFGQILKSKLSDKTQRETYVESRRAEGRARMEQVKDVVDPVLFETTDFAAMELANAIFALPDTHEKQIARALILALYKQTLLMKASQASIMEYSLHANQLRQIVQKELSMELQKLFTAKQVAHLYNTKLLNLKFLRGWIQRGNGKDCGIWTIRIAETINVLNATVAHLKERDALRWGDLNLVENNNEQTQTNENRKRTKLDNNEEKEEKSPS